MQKTNSVEKMHLMNGMQHMKSTNFRFISMLLIAFLLQHFSFATLQNSLGFSNLNSGTVLNSYFEKGTFAHQNSQLDIFIESESEDEDELHNMPVYLKGFISNHSDFKSLHYTGFINTLYLRLASSNLLKVELPYFILYHAWKSDLS